VFQTWKEWGCFKLERNCDIKCKLEELFIEERIRGCFFHCWLFRVMLGESFSIVHGRLVIDATCTWWLLMDGRWFLVVFVAYFFVQVGSTLRFCWSKLVDRYYQRRKAILPSSLVIIPWALSVSALLHCRMRNIKWLLVSEPSL